MKIWFQLLSSETGMAAFIAATQRLADRAAFAGTTVEVRGTTHGVLGDQYRLFCNYDSRELIDNALRIRAEGGYDAFVVANSLDPAMVELREMLDIPVISFMEVCSYAACSMGDKFGVIGVNRKLMSWYRNIITSYGLAGRLAAVEHMEADDTRSLNLGFTDEAAATRLQEQLFVAARRAIERGRGSPVRRRPSGGADGAARRVHGRGRAAARCVLVAGQARRDDGVDASPHRRLCQPAPAVRVAVEGTDAQGRSGLWRRHLAEWMTSGMRTHSHGGRE